MHSVRVHFTLDISPYGFATFRSMLRPLIVEGDNLHKLPSCKSKQTNKRTKKTTHWPSDDTRQLCVYSELSLAQPARPVRVVITRKFETTAERSGVRASLPPSEGNRFDALRSAGWPAWRRPHGTGAPCAFRRWRK